MLVFNSRQLEAVWADGALFKPSDLFQGVCVDPMRDVVGALYSTTPMTAGNDLLPGYIRQAAKNIAGKWETASLNCSSCPRIAILARPLINANGWRDPGALGTSRQKGAGMGRSLPSYCAAHESGIAPPADVLEPRSEQRDPNITAEAG